MGSSCQVAESLSRLRYVVGLSLLSPSASSAKKKWRTSCLQRWSLSLSTALCNCRFQSLSSSVRPVVVSDWPCLSPWWPSACISPATAWRPLGTNFEAARGKSSSANAAAFPISASCCPSVTASRTYTKSEHTINFATPLVVWPVNRNHKGHKKIQFYYWSFNLHTNFSHNKHKQSELNQMVQLYPSSFPCWLFLSVHQLSFYTDIPESHRDIFISIKTFSKLLI